MKQASLCALLALGTALLMACGDSPTSAPDDTMTVHGTVVDEYLQPQASVGVLVTGHALVITDADGRFSVSRVKKPYELATGLLSERAALVYAGLTREDLLVVVPPSPFSTQLHGAYFWGSVYGGTGLPEPANHKTSVLFESPETRWVGSVIGGYAYPCSLNGWGPRLPQALSTRCSGSSIPRPACLSTTRAMEAYRESCSRTARTSRGHP